MEKSNLQKKDNFLFSLEVLVEGETNGKALEKLLHALNSNEINDYKILKGMNLGPAIDKALTARAEQTNEKQTDKANEAIVEQIQNCKEKGTLVRLNIVKSKGIRLNIPCRILNYDADSSNVSVYHVDEKRTYLFKLNEIDDLVEN